MAEVANSSIEKAKSLSDFARYVKEEYASDLIDAHVDELSKISGSLKKLLDKFTDSEIQKLASNSLEEIGDIIVDWDSKEQHDVKSKFLNPELAKEFFNAQKKALNKFISIYTADSNEAISLSEDLNTFYSHIQDIAVEIFFKIRDETDRKLYEIKSVFENPILGICFLDDQGTFVSVNSTYTQMIGLDEKAILGKKWQSFVHPDDEKKVNSVLGKLSEKRMVQVEVRCINKDKKEWAGEIMIISNDDPENRYKGIHWFIKDVTVVKRSKKEIENEMARFRSVILKSNDIITVLDKSGLIKSITPSVEVILGYTPEELIRKSVFEFIHPADVKNVIKYFRLITQKEIKKIPMGFRFLKKGGGWCFIEAIGSNLLNDPDVEGIVINGRNVTERKEAEQKLVESEHKYRTLIERMNEGLLYVDNDGVIQFVNEQFCNLVGYKEDELVGKIAHTIFLNGNMQSWIYLEKIKENAEAKKEQYELSMKTKSGKSIWVLANSTPMIDRDGIKTGYMITHNDITARRNAEEQLKLKNNELNTFVYKASHDLKGPLASIIGLTNIAKDELKEENALNYIDLIAKSSKRLDSILMDLIDLTRISQGKTLNTEVNITQMIKDILTSLDHMPNFANIKLKLELASIKDFYNDQKLLNSIFQNLIDNAIKYQSDKRKDPYVKIRTKRSKNGIIFEVQDNGEGIDKDIKDKIFEMFYRGNTKSTGTGLGLYIVKTSIEKLGGTLNVESENNKGSLFTVFIPNVGSNILEENKETDK